MGRFRGTRHARALAVAFAMVLGAGPAAAQSETDLEDRGRALFEAKCTSCHGIDGSGSQFGPPLAETGAAGADFYLRTGRMPLPHPDAPTQRKPVSLTQDQIEALVAYVASLGDGPAIPDVNTSGIVLSEGAALFASNCAPCHGATANGGAVGGTAFAPSLYSSSPLDVAEATIVGPGQMPIFTFSDEDRNALVAYVEYLQEHEDPGGLDIGGIGPVSEGYVAWALAMAILVVIVVVIGRSKAGGDET
jgi:ubiquinol-cytochrome c reductase cytochrome c subunit